MGCKSMRKQFTGMLKQLSDELTAMGGLADKSISNAVEILKSGDISLLEASKKYEEEINVKEKDIENLCLKLMLRQNPMADDFRIVSSALKIVTDMERMGDNALDIAEISKKLYERDVTFETNAILNMAQETIKMVRDSLSAYIGTDVEKAKEVINHDDVVDDLFEKIMVELSENFAEKQRNVFVQMELLMIAKYFEKIADHAVNIAEWAEFVVTGEHK